MANDTPPNKRHHLPFSVSNRNASSSNLQQHQNSQSCGGSKLNRIFVVTCVASVLLQLFGSIASWQQQSNNRPQQAGGMASFLDPMQQHHPSRSLHLQLPSSPRTADNYESPSSTALETSASSPAADTATDSGTSGTKLFPEHKGRLKVLWGVLTADFYNDQAYRKRHRKLFELWDDPRVCSLPDFKQKSVEERDVCELIYTFVVGGNQETTPELVDDSRPMTATRPVSGKSPDLNDPDMTLLNIKENMNEGKSQTWLKHGAEVAEQYGLDYVVKCDADSMLHLHEFFTFAYKHLPPAPYNTNVYAGALRDKAYWPRHTTEDERIRFESYFGNNFEGVHLYVAGQLYIMSTDLAKFVGQEALENKCSYCEGHEDHDISAMAFHSPDPIKLLVIGRKQRFWEHPVKGEPRWKRILAREQARMAGLPFEGKVFFKNSTLAAVLSK
jgi:hypothetical protein